MSGWEWGPCPLCGELVTMPENAMLPGLTGELADRAAARSMEGGHYINRHPLQAEPVLRRINEGAQADLRAVMEREAGR